MARRSAKLPVASSRITGRLARYRAERDAITTLDDDLGGQARWASVLALVVTEARASGGGGPVCHGEERCASALWELCLEGAGGSTESDWRELALAFSSDLVAALEAPAWSSSSESVLRSLARSSSQELRKAPADRKAEAYVCFLGDLLAVIVGGVSAVTKRATSSVTPVVSESGGACDVPEENQKLEALVAFQQLQLNGLQQRSSSEPLCGEALRFSVAKWHSELPDSAKALKRLLASQFAGRDVARVRRASWDQALPDKLRASLCDRPVRHRARVILLAKHWYHGPPAAEGARQSVKGPRTSLVRPSTGKGRRAAGHAV